MASASTSTALVWFRQDLRIHDNPALAVALERHETVLPLYVLDVASEGSWQPGGASKWWLHHALADLDQLLNTAGSICLFAKGDSLEILRQLIRETGATAIYWNRRYEPHAIARDSKIKSALKEDGVTVESFNAALLNEPWTINNKSGKPFQVFTPYWKHCQTLDVPSVININDKKLESSAATAPLQKKLAKHCVSLEELELLPKIKWDSGFHDTWEPNRKAGLKRLNAFLTDAVSDYSTKRNRPDIEGTSRLSPYLHWGQIGPREVFAIADRHGLTQQAGAKKFLAEIGWREFSYHLMYHFPDTPEEPLREQFNSFPWQTNIKLLRAWQKGQTGYPIVDAGMRQLWHTGWMHNRVRMIAGSLLVKHLLLPWQEGARWFWDTLVDADLASNTQGWQWTAGCGADAAPYFRIFNPMTQGAKFDPNGDYVRQWVPELKNVSTKYIHQPWEASSQELQEAGVVLGENYPEPIIDHKAGRDRALRAFEEITESK